MIEPVGPVLEFLFLEILELPLAGLDGPPAGRDLPGRYRPGIRPGDRDEVPCLFRHQRSFHSSPGSSGVVPAITRVRDDRVIPNSVRNAFTRLSAWLASVV